MRRGTPWHRSFAENVAAERKRVWDLFEEEKGLVVSSGPSVSFVLALGRKGRRNEHRPSTASVTLWSRRNSGCDLIFFSLSERERDREGRGRQSVIFTTRADGWRKSKRDSWPSAIEGPHRQSEIKRGFVPVPAGEPEKRTETKREGQRVRRRRRGRERKRERERERERVRTGARTSSLGET